MKYYFLTESTEKKETGLIGPQCMAFPEGYSLDWYEKPTSMTKLTNDSFPSEFTEFRFALDAKAKITDFISQAIILAKGLLINDRVKSLLEKCNLQGVKFYDATITHQNEVLEYYWLHIIHSDIKFIDFKKSEFYEGHHFKFKKENLEINSFDDIANASVNIMAEKIFLSDEFKKMKIDIMIFPFMHYNIFVSERIVKLLKENNIKGY